MEHKYVIEHKILAIKSVANLNDLQTDIFQFCILIGVLKRTLDVLASVKNIARTSFDLDHLAILIETFIHFYPGGRET